MISYDSILSEMQQQKPLDESTEKLLHIAIDGINCGKYTVDQVLCALDLIARRKKALDGLL